MLFHSGIHWKIPLQNGAYLSKCEDMCACVWWRKRWNKGSWRQDIVNRERKRKWKSLLSHFRNSSLKKSGERGMYRYMSTEVLFKEAILVSAPLRCWKKLFFKDSAECMYKSPALKKAARYVIYVLESGSGSCRVLWDGFRHCKWCLWKLTLLLKLDLLIS